MIDVYASKTVPANYKCQVCGASGIKLWRMYMTTAPDLLCASCAAKDQGQDISTLDEHGELDNGYGGGTDQIGWFIPAVPSPDGSYWGYASIPERASRWWMRLPNKKEVA